MSKQWNLNVPPLAELSPIDPTRTRLPTGPYAVLISATEGHVGKASNSQSIKFTCIVQEAGDFKGRQVDLYAGTDMSKDGVKRGWKGILMSVGAPPHVMANPLQLGPATFDGKQAFIYVQAAPEGEKDARDNRNFVTPEMYQQLKAQQAAQGGASTAPAAPQVGAATFGAPGVQPPAFGGAIPQPGIPNGVGALGANLGGGLPPPAVPAAPAAATGGVSF